MNRRSFALALLAALVVTTSPAAQDQNAQQTRVTGTLSDYVWVEGGGATAGAWHASGTWSARLLGDSGKAEFVANILGMRSDLWVLQTGQDPQTTNRSPHTHHVGLLEADITPIAGGVRLTGTAIITTNGTAAPFSGSPVVVEITGGNLVTYSNMRLMFQGAAIGHFGSQSYDGVVTIER